MQPNSSDGKDAIGTNKGIYIKAAGNRSICIWDTYTSNTIGLKDASSIRNICVRNSFVKDFYTENICTRVTSAINCLKMHLQSF